MKKSIVLSTALLVAAFAGQVFADDCKIGVVNVGQILKSSEKVQAATKQIQEKFAKRQEAIKAQQDELQASMAQFKKDAEVMKPEDKKQLKEKIDGQRKKLLADIAAFQKELSAEQSASMKKVFDALNKVVKHVAEEEELTAVLDSQFALYVDKDSDITDEVQKEFGELSFDAEK